MTALTSILAATDFSLDGNNAVRRAALLARAHGARLHVVHVLKPGGCKALRDWFSPSLDLRLKTAQVHATLRRFAAEIVGRYDVEASVELKVGDTLDALMQASTHAELVVLGMHGSSPLRALLIGRTVDRMLRTCRRPLLVVKQAANGPYRRLLVPIDFTVCSDAALRLAARLARGADLQVFHAVDSQREAMLRRADVAESIVREASAREETGARARMARKIAGLHLGGTAMSLAVSRGAAAQATLDRAAALDADLIVAGKQGQSGMSSFLLGSVSSRVLAAARCDMLIVPRPGADTPAAALRPGFERDRVGPGAPAGQAATAAA